MQKSSNKHFKLSDAELILICFAASEEILKQTNYHW